MLCLADVCCLVGLVFVRENRRCGESLLASRPSGRGWISPAGLGGSPLGCTLPCRVNEVQTRWREQASTNAACAVRQEFSACTQSMSLSFSCTGTLSECQKGPEGPQHPGSHHAAGTTPWVPGKHVSTGWDACGSLTAFWLFIPTNIVTSNRNTGKGYIGLYHLHPRK